MHYGQLENSQCFQVSANGTQENQFGQSSLKECCCRDGKDRRVLESEICSLLFRPSLNTNNIFPFLTSIKMDLICHNCY